MPLSVVLGATLQCTCGSEPSKLLVTSQSQVTIGGKPAATINDNIALANILPFGTCSVLTAAAQGVPSPCVPMPAGPWMPGSTSPQTIGGIPALLATDKLPCSIPGVISITEPGQQTMQDA
jgi:hypothetical protein